MDKLFDRSTVRLPVEVLAMVGAIQGGQLGILMSIVVVFGTLHSQAMRRPGQTAEWLIVSTLFVPYTIFGIRHSVLLVGALVFGRVLSGMFPGPVGRIALVPALMVVSALVSFFVRPPTSTAGQFAIFEQAVLLVVAAVLLGTAPRTALNASDGRPVAVLMALALISGVDGLRNAAVDSSFESSRQLLSAFGGSNYIAALLAAGIVAGTYGAVIDRRYVWINSVCVVTLSALLLPLLSRTSTAVAILVCLTIVYRAASGKVAKHFFVFAGAVSALAIPMTSQYQAFRARDSSIVGLNGRTDLWNFGYDSWVQSPWFGVGSGRLTDQLQLSGYIPFYVHNIWLSFLVQYGSILALLGAAFLARLLLTLRGAGAYICVTLLAISTFEPAVETLKLGTIFIALAAASRYSEKRLK